MSFNLKHNIGKYLVKSIKTDIIEPPQQLVWISNYSRRHMEEKRYVTDTFWQGIGHIYVYPVGVEIVQSLLEGNSAVGIKITKHKSYGQTIPLPEVYPTDTMTHA